MLKRRFTPFVAAAVLAGMTAVPAFAEGKWESSITGANTGFKTRTWEDKNTDNKSTTFGGRNCTAGPIPASESRPKSFTMQLIRYDTWTPNEKYAKKVIPCKGTTFYDVSWGNKGKGKFGLTLVEINGSDWGYGHPLNVKYVKATY